MELSRPLAVEQLFYPMRTYVFRGEQAWHPPDEAMPTFRVLN